MHARCGWLRPLPPCCSCSVLSRQVLLRLLFCALHIPHPGRRSHRPPTPRHPPHPTTMATFPAGAPAPSVTEQGFASTRAKDEHNVAETLDYAPLLGELNHAFRAGHTRPLAWRRRQLEGLVRGMKEMHQELTAAVRADHGGAKLRGVAELTVIDEAEFALARLADWAAPKQVKNNFLENPNGSAEVVPSPKGTVLLISPWNYPIGLALKPLVAILAAGNCVVIKPSEVSANSAVVIQRLVERYLDPAGVRVVLGGVAETTALLREKWAHIVYTGNGDVARIILAAAAKHLTPCTLELGGKSPVIVDSTADVKVAARRVAWGKWSTNAGQTCIAPDYVLVARKHQDAFIDELKSNLAQYYPNGPLASPDYGEIINARHVGRLQRILAQSPGASVAHGDAGSINPDRCFVPPLILRDAQLTDAVLREEIFGPILPVVAVDSVAEALDIVNKVCDRPLAFYLFSENRSTQDQVLDQSLSGAMVINGCNFEQYANSNVPFGGVGESGTGELHGEWGFREVSHMRAVMRKSTSWPFTKMDLPPPPYADKLYDTIVKVKYTGILSPGIAKLAKVAGVGALVLAAVGGMKLKSRL